MYPILKSGDIVGFKEISSFSNVIYGEMYLVSFNIDGDEYLAVKYVNRSEIDGCIKLVSYNPVSYTHLCGKMSVLFHAAFPRPVA